MKQRFDGTEVKLEDIIANCHKLGVKRITLFTGVVGRYRFSDQEVPPTYDEVMREIEELEAVATECKKEGNEFANHNHDIELQLCYRGVPALYLIKQFRNLKIELISMVPSSGKDPHCIARSR